MLVIDSFQHEFAREPKSVLCCIAPWNCFQNAMLLLLAITRLPQKLFKNSSPKAFPWYNSIHHRLFHQERITHRRIRPREESAREKWSSQMGFLHKKDNSVHPTLLHAQLPHSHRSNFALNLISLRTVPTRNWQPKFLQKYGDSLFGTPWRAKDTPGGPAKE